ncbi:MAG TPA: tail fiber protein [Candidatus Competibacteraceae bacterium]|nr:tail fiber protein [Candidatus Competibacteraceae bacterium]
MADPFVAEIRIFPFNFAPTGWAFCDGQIIPLSQNTALFSLLGTTYGGDGKSNFALPDLQGRAAMHPGQGAGLTPRDLGESGGSETVTLSEAEMPLHSHMVTTSTRPAVENDAANQYWARTAGNLYSGNASQNSVPMAAESLAPTGGGQPHNNLMPYLTFNFCIALQGVFPPRS